MPKLIYAALGVWGGVGGEVATSRAFYYFSSLGASTEQCIERGLTLNAPQNVF